MPEIRPKTPLSETNKKGKYASETDKLISDYIDFKR